MDKLTRKLVTFGKKNKACMALALLCVFFLYAFAVILDNVELAYKALRGNAGRRIAAAALSACMVFTLLPTAAFATEGGSVALGASGVTSGAVCESHAEHNADCGYIEVVAAQPCSHRNEDGSYSCAPVLDSGDVATASDADYACDHSDDCGYAEAVEGAPCTHKCELCEVKDSGVVLPLITGFAPLSEEIRTQRVGADDLVLPETLLATVEDEETEIAVTWDGLDAVNEARKSGGLFVLTANVGEGYRLAEGVTAPTISAMILGMGRILGAGTEANPLQLRTEEQLREIAVLTNAGTLSETVFGAGKTDKVYIKLMNDLDISGSQWTPIGMFTIGADGPDMTKAFNGVFDGGGNTITGLTINQPTMDDVGLFGWATGDIQNLGVINVSVTGNNSVGGVVGRVDGTVTGCYTTGTVIGGANNVGWGVGGVVGMAKGNIDACAFSGSITGAEDVGGVVGSADGAISNCYSTGSVTGGYNIGGVVGSTTGAASNCYSTATVTGTGMVTGSTTYVGGVVGSPQISLSVTDCVALNPAITTTSSNPSVGRVTGSGTISDCFAFAGMTVNGATISNGTATDPNGADIANLATLDGKFDNTTVWNTFDGTTLPTLVGVGQQTLARPAHLNSGNPFAGTGTDVDPYQIATADQLRYLGTLVSSRDTNYNTSTVYYKLTANLDISGSEWTPIGNGNATFKSNFDGDGHTITGLTINQPTMNYVGLFGVTSSSSSIQNLGVINASVTGGSFVGSVVGNAFGDVTNCYSTGGTTGGVNSNNVGGVVGGASGTVINCYSTGTVTGKQYVGGVVGVANGAVSNCYSTGTVTGEQYVGGMVGFPQSSASITNCVALNPSITATDSSSKVGRVVGDISSGGSVSGCSAFAGMKVNGATVTGGTATDINGANITDLATLDGKFTDAGGWSAFTAETLPTFKSAEANSTLARPAHLLATPFKGAGTESDPYQISTADQLRHLGTLVNGGDTTYNAEGKYFKLTANLDISGSEWTPIGNGSNKFAANFDGDGHTITGLTINQPTMDHVGLFGYAKGTIQTIQNLGVINADVTGKSNVGGVVGYTYGAVSNCYSTGSVTGSGCVGGVVGIANGNAIVSNCYSTGSVTGSASFVGGVVGYASKTLSNCYSTGSITGNTWVGGVVGLASSTVSNCYSTGSVTGSGPSVGGVAGCAVSASNCYSTGNVTGGDYNVGGVVGEPTSGTVTNCVALNPSITATDSGTIYVGRVAGKLASVNTVSGCSAFAGMTVNGSIVTDGTATDINGADATKASFKTANWWKTTAQFSDASWVLANNNLPALKTTGGTLMPGQKTDLPVFLTELPPPPVVSAITKATTTNGSFTVQVGTTEVTKAAAGDTVKIAPWPGNGYKVDTVTVTKTGASTVVTVTNNTFTMPAYGVTVTVTFKSNVPTDSFAVKVVSTVGGTSSNSSYTITSETSPNTAENQPASAKAGEMVTVALRTTQSDSGPQSVSLNVAGIPVARSYDNPSQFTFTMPAQAADLTITFGAKNTVYAKPYYYPTGTATPPSADGSIAAVSYTSAVLLTGTGDTEFSPSNCTIDGYIYKFSDDNDYGTVDTSGTHLVYTPNVAAAGKTISIFVKAYSGGGISQGAIEHKVTVGEVPVPDYNKDASLSALTYQITDGASGSVSLQANQYEYTVELPFGTAVNKVVTLTPTLNDPTAAITAQTTGNTTYGTLNGVDRSDIATVTVTAQDPSVIKVYKVSFLIKEPDVQYSVTNKDTGAAYQDGDTITISTGDTVRLSVNHGCGTGGAGAFHYAVEDTSIVYSAPGAGAGIYPNTMHLVTLEAKKVGNTKFVVQFYTEQTTDFVGKTPIDTITLNLVCPDTDIAAAKSAAENAAYTATTQADCTDENTAKAYVENIAKAAVNNNGVTVAATNATYTAPVAGTSANPGGTNGSYKFKITVSKGAQSDTTVEKTLTITATAFTGITDVQAVAAAKAAVVGGNVNVAFGADQDAKTAAVQTYVNGLLTGNAAGVTATVEYNSSSGKYDVALKKGSVTDSKSITMTVTESPDPDIATIAAAKTAAEGATYAATTQAACADENAAKAYVENIAKAAVNNSGVTVAATKVSYTAPTAGTAANPSGTNGSYKFTVTVSKGLQSDTTTEKTLTITATPYTSPTHKPVSDITGIPTAATANVALLLTGTVNPADATNQTIVWSVKTAGDTGATITGNTLSTTAAGTVVVTAKIVNGAGASTDYTQDITITVSAAPTTDAEKIAAVKAAIEAVLSNLTVSNTTTAQDILDAANGVASNGVTVAWDSANAFAKTDATVDTTGSITGSLKLTLNSETATVAVNKTIPKLTAVTYTITASAGTGGSISPSGSVTVTNGGNQSFTISASSGYSISSVTVDGVNQGAIGSYTFSNVTAGHTISANFSYNGGGSGGDSGSSSGGGSSSGSIIVTPPTPDKPNAPTESEIKVPGKVDGNGNATATVTDKAVSDAIKQAEDAARKNGNLDNGITLVLNVDTGSKTANTVSVNLPKVTQETIISKKIVSTVLVVNNPDIQIGIDLAAVKEINTQAKADVSISATRMDNEKLTGAAKTAIGNRPAFDLKATYQNGSKSVTGFGGGSVSVALPYTLQAGEVAGGLYAVYVDANGKVSYITGSSYDAQNKVLRFATNHFSVYGIGYKAPAAFTDIANHWAKTDIEFVANRGLMNGTSNTTFSPNGSMTRGMFVTALGRLAGIDSTKYTNTKFTDVAATSYYAPYVAWATEKGVTVGTSTTTFSPDKIVTRQEMAVFMSRYAEAMNYKVPATREAVTFADNGSIGSWAAAAVKQMQMAGVLNGKNGNKFDPTGTATRAEVAAVLHRYVELVIDPTTAQGLDTNDSGSAMLYVNGKLVKNQSRTVNSRTYAFNQNGEAVLPADSKKYLLHTVKKNEYFYSISRMYGCTQEEIMALNGLRMGDMIHPGDVLKVPEK